MLVYELYEKLLHLTSAVVAAIIILGRVLPRPVTFTVCNSYLLKNAIARTLPGGVATTTPRTSPTDVRVSRRGNRIGTAERAVRVITGAADVDSL